MTPDQKITEAREGVAWLCSICGFHPESSGRWCAAGCGSDYREMTKLEGLPAIELHELWAERDHYRSAYEGLVAALRRIDYIAGVNFESSGEMANAVDTISDLARAALPDPKED